MSKSSSIKFQACRVDVANLAVLSILSCIKHAIFLPFIMAPMFLQACLREIWILFTTAVLCEHLFHVGVPP